MIVVFSEIVVQMGCDEARPDSADDAGKIIGFPAERVPGVEIEADVRTVQFVDHPDDEVDVPPEGAVFNRETHPVFCSNIGKMRQNFHSARKIKPGFQIRQMTDHHPGVKRIGDFCAALLNPEVVLACVPLVQMLRMDGPGHDSRAAAGFPDCGGILRVQRQEMRKFQMAESVVSIIGNPSEVDFPGITGNVVHFGSHNVAADVAVKSHDCSNVDILINPICKIDYNENIDIVNGWKKLFFCFIGLI